MRGLELLVISNNFSTKESSMSIQRSKPYPSLSLQDAVTRIQSLKDKAGVQQKYSREIFAQGIGYKGSTNGAFIRAVAALSQYNLVIKDGDGYALTNTAKGILIPTTSSSVRQATREAALSPDLFKSLYDDFKGEKLPALLPNILVQQYGILDGVKSKAQNVFISTMEYAGLLSDDNLLDETANSQGEAAIESDLTNPKLVKSNEEASATVPSTTLKKDFGGGRIVSIVLPNDINDDERKKIVLLIENM